ncbi:hypothetical protein KPL71_027286 [Citrus sinensis]|uniref:Uncharacterized protein n=1 Tax=Citrus sinensis TaxID=2711 RepID=A0ACB8I752_CITSI|nr:hypothetical protein KPL71_027286 [Citrus sinensis]
MQSLHTVVATLIATVTFAAGFTLPGGYWGKEGPIPGTPILIKNAGFQAFVVSDVIAMVLSTLRQTPFLSEVPHYLILVSLLAMVVAFTTGTYAVLAPSVGLSVATCVLGSSFSLFAFVTMFMLHLPCVLSHVSLPYALQSWDSKIASEIFGGLSASKVIQQTDQIFIRVYNIRGQLHFDKHWVPHVIINQIPISEINNNLFQVSIPKVFTDSVFPCLMKSSIYVDS